MLGPPKLRLLDRPVTVSLEALLPQDNCYRFLDAKLDLSFVRTWVQDCYADRGRPSIDPVVFFKLQIILFFAGLRSERQLMQTVALNLAQRWYLGYQLNEPLPDHSSLTRIRQRLGLPLFQRFFAHVVEHCQQVGLVWGTELIFDGTKVRANADIDALVPRWYTAATAHLGDLFADAVGEPPAETTNQSDPPPAEAAQHLPPAEAIAVAVGDGDADLTVPSPLPFSGTTEQEQELAQQNRATWKLLDELRLDPNRPARGGYQRITDLRVSTTDPDAAPLRVGGEPRLGYHDHYAVDGGKARIILGALGTPADVQDNQALLDLLDRVRFRSHLHVRRVIGDSKDATGENLRGLAERGMRASMPVVDYEQSRPFFRHADFTSAAETDRYRCPNGATLTYRGNHYTTRVRSYTAPPSVCQACPLRARCTDGKGGRRLNRPFDEAYREQAQQLQTTAAYAKAMRKRQVWVEPLFGEAKEWHGLRRFR